MHLSHRSFSRLARLGAGLLAAALTATAAPRITPAKDIIGFTLGDDYHVANYTQTSALLKKWDAESDRLKVVSIGQTEEGRPQYMAIVTSAANHGKLDRYQLISQALSRAEIPEAEARRFAHEGKTVVWIDGGLHATESVNSQSLAELVFDLISKDDDETRQILDNTIAILPWANPDGLELVADWYMRNPDQTKRSFQGLPRLYQKYAGHDNNRDSISHNLQETINQNRVLYIDWNPQLMINHHQSGPAGSIVFIPPFRDPYNYNYDPLIPLGIQQAGAAVHARLVSKGLGGSVARSVASYSTWANGGIRYATYFRNQIGLMTEIFGSPTPSVVPLVADRQLANGDAPLPVKPGLWHYRQSIDYQLEINRGLLVYAAVNREQLLFNIYTMGRNSIARGSRDSWTITPKRIDALKAAGKVAAAQTAPTGARGDSPEEPPAGEAPGMVGSPFSTKTLPVELYEKVLRDPAFRDPRGYIISADQEDFPTAVKFVNSLLKGGIYVHKATAAFELNGKKFPAGSYVVKTAQAFRPAVLDAFEPLDHPTDLEYPGGPPKRPYDIAGWTLAAQSAIQFDRVYEDFQGPFQRLPFDLEKPPGRTISGAASPAGYVINHRVNDAFIVTNRLLAAGAGVYWLKDERTIDGQYFAPGTIWVPASAQARPVLERAARELGVPVLALADKPTGDAFPLRPVRIGLVDVYGGSMPSGWTRWLLEKYEFPFEVIFPPTLDAGGPEAKFDVIILPSGVYSERRTERGDRGGPLDPKTLPEEYRGRLGKVTAEKTAPALKRFVEQGGTVVAVGTSSLIGKFIGLPLKDHLVEKTADGKEKHLPAAKFYVPGSVLKASFNPANPLAYGLAETGYVFFQDSPTFARPEGAAVAAERVAWFADEAPLYSGWALGQEYLRGGELAAEATLGKGKLALLGLEATFRGTPHGTFKLLFNGIHLGATTRSTQL